MSVPMALKSKRDIILSKADDVSGSLDVSWLLDSKKDPPPRTNVSLPSNNTLDPPPRAEPSPPQLPDQANERRSPPTTSPQFNGLRDSPETNSTPTPTLSSSASSQPVAVPASTESKTSTIRPPLLGRKSNENHQQRRSSWISSWSSKFSSSGPASPGRNGTVDEPSKNNRQPAPDPKPSPKVEFANPFGGHPDKNAKIGDSDKPLVTHTVPQRRPSQTVLVTAGNERKEPHSSFLSSALRRFSSSGSTGLSKDKAGVAQVSERKVMNIDQNRERVKIADFDQNKLKRVAFCVDVEIAGIAGYADEVSDEENKAPQIPVTRRQSLLMLEQQTNNKKKRDAKDAKSKDKAEGAGMKNPRAVTEQKEQQGITKVDPVVVREAAQEPTLETDNTESAAQPNPTTKKKEKKKRSEAERKERREKKRRQAEANGEVPLELSKADDNDDDSTPGNSPSGGSTPQNGRTADQPTIDPLRIYKRCCQLRETTALNQVIEQISMPSSTLAEAPGTVAVLDLSGLQIPHADVVTLGDSLAVVPVRKLILEDCDLTDEGVRVVLAGLLCCKSLEQAKQNKKLPRRGSGKSGQEQMCVVEKISLKGNSNISNLGWKHIALFLHMSRSVKAIDLSGIAFPKSSGDLTPSDLSRTSTTTGTSNSSNGNLKSHDLGILFAKALAERLGTKLEELILNSCSLTTTNIHHLLDSAIKCRLKRLGLAGNHLTEEALEYIVRYLKSGVCEGLDLGQNDLHDRVQRLTDSMDKKTPLFALSLSGCNLTSSDMNLILPKFADLRNFRFLDLSHNRSLFSDERNAVPVLRKYLPKIKTLRRIHLADCNMTSDQAIALAEILPECSSLAHISIADNPQIVQLMSSGDSAAQEEACALFASLMTAVRVSHTIVAIDIEIPSANSSEVVKALASQVVAYSLRNMEHGTLNEMEIVETSAAPSKNTPEVLLQIVGHMEGYKENHDNDEPAPDENYMIASTGIVKALGVCLGTADIHSRNVSRNITPEGSGTATPQQGGAELLGPTSQKKARDMTRQLLDSARKIRLRLRPALIKEDRAGNDINYRRLHFLDTTLERMIQRYEDEYPETRLQLSPSSTDESRSGLSSLASSFAENSVRSASIDEHSIAKVLSAEEVLDAESRNRDDQAVLDHSASNTSLAARALTREEGRMHRFGQSFRREILRPTGTDDYLHGTTDQDESEPPHLVALRERLNTLRGDEIRKEVERDGPDKVLEQLNCDVADLWRLEQEDPVEFPKLNQSQLAAHINAGRKASIEVPPQVPGPTAAGGAMNRQVTS